jgi:hypothetical protein
VQRLLEGFQPGVTFRRQSEGVVPAAQARAAHVRQRAAGCQVEFDFGCIEPSRCTIVSEEPLMQIHLQRVSKSDPDWQVMPPAVRQQRRQGAGFNNDLLESSCRGAEVALFPLSCLPPRRRRSSCRAAHADPAPGGQPKLPCSDASQAGRTCAAGLAAEPVALMLGLPAGVLAADRRRPRQLSRVI